MVMLNQSDLDLCWRPLTEVAGLTSNILIGRRWGKAIVADLQRAPVLIGLDQPRITFGRREMFRYLCQEGVYGASEEKTACQFAENEIDAYTELINAGIRILDSMPGNRGELFRQLITEIAVFDVNRPEAGTVSSVNCLIYLSYRPEWSAAQMAENLWHEAGHVTLNLFDMTQSLMPHPDLLDDPTNRCHSAVRREPRGFHSAYHAAFVAALLIPFHHDLAEISDLNQSRLVREMRENGRRAVRELREVQSRTASAGRPILTELGTEWLDRIANTFDLASTTHFDWSWPFLGFF